MPLLGTVCVCVWVTTLPVLGTVGVIPLPVLRTVGAHTIASTGNSGWGVTPLTVLGTVGEGHPIASTENSTG